MIRTALSFVLGGLIVLSPSAFGSEGKSQVDIAGGLIYFKGVDAESLAGDMGYLLRFQGEMGRDSFFRVFGNLTILFGTGNATFSDAGADVDLGYQMVGGEFVAGLKLSVLKWLKKSPVQPFVAGFGTGHLNSMQFSGTASATFPMATNGLFYGYGYQAGVDFYFSKDYGAQLVFEQSELSGSVAGSSFSLSGLRYFISFTMY